MQAQPISCRCLPKCDKVVLGCRTLLAHRFVQLRFFSDLATLWHFLKKNTNKILIFEVPHLFLFTPAKAVLELTLWLSMLTHRHSLLLNRLCHMYKFRKILKAFAFVFRVYTTTYYSWIDVGERLILAAVNLSEMKGGQILFSCSHQQCCFVRIQSGWGLTSRIFFSMSAVLDLATPLEILRKTPHPVHHATILLHKRVEICWTQEFRSTRPPLGRFPSLSSRLD